MGKPQAERLSRSWRIVGLVFTAIAVMMFSPVLLLILTNQIWVTVVASKQPASDGRGFTVHQPLGLRHAFRIHLFANLISIRLEAEDGLRGEVEHRWLCGDRAVFLSFESAYDSGEGHPTKILYDFERGELYTACLRSSACAEPILSAPDPNRKPSMKPTDVDAKRKQIEAACAAQPGK